MKIVFEGNKKQEVEQGPRSFFRFYSKAVLLTKIAQEQGFLHAYSVA